MKIRTKILLGFAAVAAIAVILGVVGFISTLTLDGITTELKELQNESDSVSRVLNAHYVWRQTLTESVLMGNEFTGSLDPHTCALGQWHDSDEAKKMNDPELLAMLKTLDAPHDFIHTEAKTVAAYIQAGNLEAAKSYLNDVIFPKTAEVISILTDMQARYAKIVEAKDEESVNFANLMETVDAALIIAAIIVCVILSLFIAGMVSKPLIILSAFMKKAGSTGDIMLRPEDIELIGKCAQIKDEIGQTISNCAAFINHVIKISDELELIAAGNLTTEIEILSDSDVMGQSVKHTVKKFNDVLGEINLSSAQVSTGSKQIADGAQALAQGSTEQAAAIEQLSSSISEIAEKTKHNAEIAGKAAILANTIKGNAEKGSGQMDEMMSAVKDINQASQSIGKVIKVIDDIAFQTNILALNAAVEAARAGQHGKGFAVVAEEVRNLASKSAEAAKETENLIANSTEKAELGSRIAHDTAASLAEIVSGINESSQIVIEIAQSSDEQSAGIAQINIGIDQVAQVIQQNSATAEESAAASEEMSGQSAMLEELIAQFKLKEDGRVKISRSAPTLPAAAGRQITMPEKTSYMPSSGGEFGKY